MVSNSWFWVSWEGSWNMGQEEGVLEEAERQCEKHARGEQSVQGSE